VATFDSLEKAIPPIERALAEDSTLLVLDNMESVLLPPFIESPEALSDEARREADAILHVCARLNAIGASRLLFTSREALPAPFDDAGRRRELRQLVQDDAITLVQRALNRDGTGATAIDDGAADAIEHLVEAVNGHAQTLALLAPSLRSWGVDATRRSTAFASRSSYSTARRTMTTASTSTVCGAP
jgi:hypothetical protein